MGQLSFFLLRCALLALMLLAALCDCVVAAPGPLQQQLARDACDGLRRAVAADARGDAASPLLLSSYRTGQPIAGVPELAPSLANVAFVYDNALAGIALLACGDAASARRIADAVALADALLEGGLPVAEITFRTPAAADVLATIRDARPELCIGAGTVLDTESLKRAIDAGARFGLAPGFDPKIVEAAHKADLPFCPGIMTPSDLSLAAADGVRLAKFFPAGIAGGPKALSGISAPFAHLGIRFIPTGGVT